MPLIDSTDGPSFSFGGKNISRAMNRNVKIIPRIGSNTRTWKL